MEAYASPAARVPAWAVTLAAGFIVVGLGGAMLLPDAATGKISMPAPVGAVATPSVYANTTHDAPAVRAASMDVALDATSWSGDVVVWIGFALVVAGVLYVVATHRRETSKLG